MVHGRTAKNHECWRVPAGLGREPAKPTSGSRFTGSGGIVALCCVYVNRRGGSRYPRQLEKSAARPYCTECCFGCAGVADGRSRIPSFPPCSSMPYWQRRVELTVCNSESFRG